jgi:hypothetical protein
MARAHARGREDPDGGPHRHPSSGQGRSSLRQPQGGQTKIVVAMPLIVLPPPSADGVDMLPQLVEIHAIATTQLEEYARWRRTDPTSSLVHVRAS